MRRRRRLRERGFRGRGALDRCTDRRLDPQTTRRRRLRGQARRLAAARAAHGCARGARAADRPGCARELWPQALPQSAANGRAGGGQDRRRRRRRLPRARGAAGSGSAVSRQNRGRDLSDAALQDTGPQDRCQAETRTPQAPGSRDAGCQVRKNRRTRLKDRHGDRQRPRALRATSRTCRRISARRAISPIRR